MKGLRALLVHGIVLSAVIFAVYPLLWVIAIALTPGGMSGHASALPLPTHPSLENFAAVVGAGRGDATWLFVRQLTNSLVVSLLTATAAVVIAIPT